MIIRGKAELISDTKFRFTCPAGHVSTEDFSKGPIAKRMGAFGCKQMEQWWSRDGVSYDCKKCNS